MAPADDQDIIMLHLGCLVNHDASYAFACVHQVEALVDFVQRPGMGNRHARAGYLKILIIHKRSRGVVV